ncbi:hypothetical protein ACLHIM_04825 [Ligilactobacillus sp. LYQ112]|uniref:hypothetical protein n=1 Tax=Ligilactobacillus sp. LYQ112 TaxID=3391060 RepID=UPI0039837014
MNLMALIVVISCIVIPIIFFSKFLNKRRYSYIACLSALVFIGALWAINNYAQLLSNSKYIVAVILSIVVIVADVAYDFITALKKAKAKNDGSSMYTDFVTILLTTMSLIVAFAALICSINGLNISQREEPLQADFSHAIGVSRSVIVPDQVKDTLYVNINGGKGGLSGRTLRLTINPTIYCGSYRMAYLFIGNDNEHKQLSAVNIDTDKTGTKLVTTRGNSKFPCGVSGDVIRTSSNGILHCCIIVVDNQGNMEGDFAVLKPTKLKNGEYVYQEPAQYTTQLKSSEIQIDRIAKSIFRGKYSNIQWQFLRAEDLVKKSTMR